jgi:beta-lactamase superfamily II metal-dependent hydrolase
LTLNFLMAKSTTGRRAMGFEVDFLPVGNRYKSGDAIAVRWGRPGGYQVLVYDGGTTESGQALVDHVREHYRTRRVDYVVSSHPDGDHAHGLAVVLRHLRVGELWMHRPWLHSPSLQRSLADPRAPRPGAMARLRTKLRAARELEALALRRGLPIHEPFQGASIGAFQVLSPPQDWYLRELVPALAAPWSPGAAAAAPTPASAPATASRTPAAAPPGTLRLAAPLATERWDTELLRDAVQTSAENETSAVLFADFDGQGVLLTGDAGTRALTHASDWAQAQRLDLPSRLRLLQVPHHGSRHNVSPTVLDRIIGPRKPRDDGQAAMWAFVSAGQGSGTHPHRMVTNALLRRGARPYATQGRSLSYRHEMPCRESMAEMPVPFSARVGAWE